MTFLQKITDLLDKEFLDLSKNSHSKDTASLISNVNTLKRKSEEKQYWREKPDESLRVIEEKREQL